jgi:hypothetical protein
MLKTIIIAIAILIAGVQAFAQPTASVRRHVSRKSSVVRVGPSVTYLKEGFTVEEVLRLLGEPATVSKHQSEAGLVTTYEFARGQNRFLIAEFVRGVLVNSRTETRDQVALGGQ